MRDKIQLYIYKFCCGQYETKCALRCSCTAISFAYISRWQWKLAWGFRDVGVLIAQTLFICIFRHAHPSPKFILVFKRNALTWFLFVSTSYNSSRSVGIILFLLASRWWNQCVAYLPMWVTLIITKFSGFQFSPAGGQPGPVSVCWECPRQRTRLREGWSCAALPGR